MTRAVIRLGRHTDHLSLLADLSLVHTDLIGAGGFGDPGFSVPDHKDIDAALVIFYRVFLVLMKLQGLHHGPVHRNFQERCRSGVEGPVHEKEKERCKEYGSGQEKLPFPCLSVFLVHRI